MVTAISPEVFLGVLQTKQKYTGNQREASKAEMNLKQTEAYQSPHGVRYLVDSNVSPSSKSRYPGHFVAVEVKSTRMVLD